MADTEQQQQPTVKRNKLSTGHIVVILLGVLLAAGGGMFAYVKLTDHGRELYDTLVTKVSQEPAAVTGQSKPTTGTTTTDTTTTTGTTATGTAGTAGTAGTGTTVTTAQETQIMDQAKTWLLENKQKAIIVAVAIFAAITIAVTVSVLLYHNAQVEQAERAAAEAAAAEAAAAAQAKVPEPAPRSWFEENKPLAIGLICGGSVLLLIAIILITLSAIARYDKLGLKDALNKTAFGKRVFGALT